MNTEMSSENQKSVAEQLADLGAKINLAQCSHLPGYWAVDFILEGKRLRVSHSNNELVVERLTPTLRSGHEPDWHFVASQAVKPSQEVPSQAVSLVKASQEMPK